MTVDQIIDEIRNWPATCIEELVDRLAESIHASGANPAIDQAWKQEVRRRLAEIDSGAVDLIEGEKVSAEVRKIVGR
jgi:putative addiction module component (TIGR02574 family)